MRLVALEYEVKPHGVPFDGTGVETTGWLDTGAPDGAAGSRVVIEELVSGGVDPVRISGRAVGETQPLIPTADGVREERNRAVVINLQ